MYPRCPTYVKAKTDTLAQVGLVLSMYGLWQGIIRLPLGIAADWLGWRKPFILLGLAMVGLGAWLLAMGETVSALLNALIQYGNYTAAMSFLPVLAKELGATDVTLGLLVSLSMGVAALGNLTVTAIVKRVGARRLAYLAFLALLLGLVGASLAPTVPWVFIAQCFIGLAFGIGYPTLMGLSIQHVEGKERSTALGIHQAEVLLGHVRGSLAEWNVGRRTGSSSDVRHRGFGVLFHWFLRRQQTYAERIDETILRELTGPQHQSPCPQTCHGCYGA